MRRLIFLGTGNGMPVASCTSSILIEDESTNLLLDAGGGHEIIGQFHAIEKDPTSIQNIFISHADSDHILGIVPLVRSFSHSQVRRKIFCSQHVKAAIDSLFTHVAAQHYRRVLPFLDFILVREEKQYDVGQWQLNFFDLQSGKTPQLGCHILFEDNLKLAFLGDEPLKNHVIPQIENCDILIHEAFCLDKDQGHFQPHPKHHGTVKEAAIHARKAQAKKLVLFHMEDETLLSRKITYEKEAMKYFPGEVFVPVDGSTLEF